MIEKKLVVVKTTGKLQEIGIFGPILNPTKIAIDKLVPMVLNGRLIYECDPTDPGNKEKRIMLTKENVRTLNFGSVKKAVVPETPIPTPEKKEEVPPVTTEVANEEAVPTTEETVTENTPVEDNTSSETEAPTTEETEQKLDTTKYDYKKNRNKR